MMIGIIVEFKTKCWTQLISSIIILGICIFFHLHPEYLNFWTVLILVVSFWILKVKMNKYKS